MRASFWAYRIALMGLGYTHTMHLRIGTWNVEYAEGAAKNAARAARLRSENADLWVLTETNDELDLSESHNAISTEQRPTGRVGGRWTTIWSRWPVVRRLEVGDPSRCVAAEIATPGGPILVYGTVLPWLGDTGPVPLAPAKGWTEMDRVLPMQIAEWRRVRDEHPNLPLLIAGDLNMNLGGPHYYGTKRCREMLREGMVELGLRCATETESIPDGLLCHPPIDHVLVPSSWTSAVVSAWEGRTPEGARLSDHSGVVVACHS